MKRNYERWPIEAFGAHLLQSGDLDPIYTALYLMRERDLFKDRFQIGRWLVAYWCFYDAGFACWVSEEDGETFWKLMDVAAENDLAAPIGGRWPRGHERRHFRGEFARRSIRELSEKYPDNPAELITEITFGSDYQGGDINQYRARDISKALQKHYGFGPWIGFKAADMIERVLGYAVDFTGEDIYIFKDPQKAAIMLWKDRQGGAFKNCSNVRIKKPAVIEAVTKYLKGYFHNYSPPPIANRALGIQEVETILCKWKSHINGHYPPNNDSYEIWDGVSPWAKLKGYPNDTSSTAARFLNNMQRWLINEKRAKLWTR